LSRQIGEDRGQSDLQIGLGEQLVLCFEDHAYHRASLFAGNPGDLELAASCRVSKVTVVMA
jgi:hypothetical protein